MKKTKILRVLAIIMAFCLMSVAFIGCQKTDEPADTTQTTTAATENTAETAEEKKSEKGYITLVLETNTNVAYNIDLDNVTGTNGFLSVLEYMQSQNTLSYECDASGFLTRVGDVAQDTAAGRYVYLYTSVEKDQDVSAYASNVTYKDMTLISSGVGAKDMTVEDGAVIYIGTIVW